MPLPLPSNSPSIFLESADPKDHENRQVGGCLVGELLAQNHPYWAWLNEQNHILVVLVATYSACLQENH